MILKESAIRLWLQLEKLEKRETVITSLTSKEVLELALGGARSSKDVHDIFAHVPSAWARQYDDCLRESNGHHPTIGEFTCGPCDRQTDEFLILVGYAPVIEFPGEVLSSCLIEICPGVRRRVWADAASGYLFMVPALRNRTFQTAFAEVRSDLNALPGAKANTREIYLAEDDRQSVDDAEQIRAALTYNSQVPPFIKIGEQCYQLQAYMEGRLKRFLAATPTGSANLGALVEYLLHHNIAQVDGNF